jgi:hypothetical protein
LSNTNGNEIESIVNEINIMKETIECPYVVEYKGCFMKNEMIMVTLFGFLKKEKSFKKNKKKKKLVMEHCVFSVEGILSFFL